VKGKVDVVTPSGLEPLSGPAGDLVRAVLAAEGARGAVVIAFVDEETIAGLNGRYRGLEEPTDVLSFRQADGETHWPEPSKKDAVELGEVAVCLAVVGRYAREQGGDRGTQLGWTLIHGVLHLLGYDHQDDGGGRMRDREAFLLLRLQRPVRAVSAAAQRTGGP
jgi:probable rRNA maturation factor